MSVFARELNNIINSMYLPSDENVGRTESYNYGAYHTQVNENEHIIEVPLVGVSRENLTIEVQEGVLSVAAKTDVKSRFVRNFSQKWRLASDADAEAVSAKLENGLLTVRVPRVKPAKKVVNVNVV